MTTHPTEPPAADPPSLRRLPSFVAATLTTHGPYWKLSPTFARLRSWLTGASVEPSDCALALFYDDPAVTRTERCRYTVCYPIDASAAGRLSATTPLVDGNAASASEADVYAITTFPSVDAAVAEYNGPAAESPTVYARLERWMEVQGLVPDGPPRERYLAEPGSLGRGIMHVELQQSVRQRA